MVTFLNNFLLGIALTLPLGPVTLEILRRGIQLDFEEGVKTFLGAFAAELTYFTLVYLGLSRISENIIVNMVLGILGVCFLLFLGYENIMDYFSKVDPVAKKFVKNSSYLVGYLITFLNPVNFFMWVGIIGSFFAQNANLVISSGVLAGIFLSLAIVALVSKLGNKVINKKRMKYVSLVAGLFLVYYGLRLAYNLIF